MHSTRLLLLTLGILGTVVAEKCFHVPQLQDFDVEKFYNNTWYEVMRSVNNFGPSGECATIRFDISDFTNVSVVYEYTSTSLSLGGTVQEDEMNITYVAIQFPLDSMRSRYYVLDTDYESFALTYSCYEDSENHIKERLWVLNGTQGAIPNSDIIEDAISKQGEEFQKRFNKSLSPCMDGDSCFDMPSMPNLNTEAMFNGTWYEVVRSTNDLEEDFACATVEYRYNSGAQTVLIKYTHSNGILDGFGTVLETGNMNITFPNQYLSNYVVLNTDYDSYAVVYSCSDIEIGNETVNAERLWILGRSYDIPEELLPAVSVKFNNLLLNQTNCPELTTTDSTEMTTTEEVHSTTTVLSTQTDTTVDLQTTITTEVAIETTTDSVHAYFVPGSSYRFFFLFQFDPSTIRSN